MQIQSLLGSRNRTSVLLVIIFFFIIFGLAFNGHWLSIIKDDTGNKIIDVVDSNKQAVQEVPNHANAISDGKKASFVGAQSLKFSEASPIVWSDSEDQKNELELWYVSRGKVNSTYAETYDSYDKATLEAMALNNHDVTAMTYLGRRALNMEEMRKWYNMAAIYGSSFALMLASSKSAGISQAEPEDIKRAALTDALMYKKVAELRNDYRSSRGAAMDLYESSLGLTLNEQDKVIAEEKSHQLYSALEAQRVELGLGKFDNSVPPLVEAFYIEVGLKK
jgi:hypothetical protein